jgi:hypothetical protein
MDAGLGPAVRHPVVFLPGPGLPAGAWQPWVELFGLRGYPATAPDRHRGRPDGPSVLAGYGSGGLLALARAGQASVAGVIALGVPAASAPAGDSGDPVLLVVSDQGPSLITGPGWRAVARSCLSWLDAHEL